MDVFAKQFSDLPRGCTRQEGRWPWQTCQGSKCFLILNCQKLMKEECVWLYVCMKTSMYLLGSHPYLPDVKNEKKDVAHLDHSPELPPCLDVQLKVAEREFETQGSRVGGQKTLIETYLSPSSCNLA